MKRGYFAIFAGKRLLWPHGQSIVSQLLRARPSLSGCQVLRYASPGRRRLPPGSGVDNGTRRARSPFAPIAFPAAVLPQLLLPACPEERPARGRRRASPRARRQGPAFAVRVACSCMCCVLRSASSLRRHRGGVGWGKRAYLARGAVGTAASVTADGSRCVVLA